MFRTKHDEEFSKFRCPAWLGVRTLCAYGMASVNGGVRAKCAYSRTWDLCLFLRHVLSLLSHHGTQYLPLLWAWSFRASRPLELVQKGLAMWAQVVPKA